MTSNEIPGYEIRRVHGEVFGVTVLALPWTNTLSAGLRSVGGGEVPEMTNLLLQGRTDALGRMIYHASHQGANAIVAMRFDTGEIMQRWVEVCAYGTGVQAIPVSESARRDYAALVAAGRAPQLADLPTALPHAL